MHIRRCLRILHVSSCQQFMPAPTHDMPLCAAGGRKARMYYILRTYIVGPALVGVRKGPDAAKNATGLRRVADGRVRQKASLSDGSKVDVSRRTLGVDGRALGDWVLFVFSPRMRAASSVMEAWTCSFFFSSVSLTLYVSNFLTSVLCVPAASLRRSSCREYETRTYPL